MELIILRASFIFFSAVLLFALGYVIYWGLNLNYLHHHGKHTKGVVTEYEERDCGPPCYSYTIRFIDIESKDFEVELYLEKEYAIVGDTLPLMYPEGKRYKAQVVDSSKYDFTTIVAGVLIVLVALIGCLWGYFKADKIYAYVEKKQRDSS